MRKKGDERGVGRRRRLAYKFNSHGIAVAGRWTKELMIALHAWYTFDDITAHIEAKCH